MSFLHSAAGFLSALFLIAPLSAQVVEPVIVEHVQEVLQPQQSEESASGKPVEPNAREL